MNFSESILPPTGKSNRRSFLRRALGMGAGVAALPAALTLAPKSARAVDAETLAQDLSVLTLALNLEYLEAEYYTYAQTGTGIEENGVGITGTTAPGTTTIKANPKVPFVTADIANYAAEIAQDERNHVNAIRGIFESAGVTPPARPNIDLLNSFNQAAQAAGIGASFDPFASEVNFLLGAFIFEDVGVTAYHGGAPYITDAKYITAAAGILAVEAIHAALVRVNILLQGADAQALAEKISNLRDSLDGASDKDQGLVDARGFINIVPTTPTGIVYDRTLKKVLNVVYGKRNATSGGFFPSGING